MRDLDAGTTSVISRAPGGALGDDQSAEPAISDDGNRVLFTSNATNLHPDDTASGDTAYIVDLPGGTPQPVGRADGATGAVDSNGSNDLRLSPDGRFVAFSTTAAVDAADTNDELDVYLRDTQLNTTRRVSLGTGGVQLTAAAAAAGISRDGRCVMFETDDGAIQPGTPLSQDFTLLAVRAVTADCPVPAPVVAPPARPAPGPVADTTAPLLTNVSLTRKRFRVVGVRVRPLPGRRLTPAGSLLRLRLSESSRVRLVFERRAKGKRVNRRCVAPTRARAKRPNCVRFLRAGVLTRPTLAAGARRIPITGKIGRRALKPGAYRLSVTAIDAAGNRSAVRRVNFTIVRR
jgi:Tol biopolymer transport system component